MSKKLHHTLDASDPAATRVKITDFGLSMDRLYQTHAYGAQNEDVPFRWMPPEALKKRRFTEKSDVWAFGVTAWELLTDGEVPFAFIASNEAIAERVCGGERLTRPGECPDALWALLLRMWAERPADRPTFAEVADALVVLRISVPPVPPTLQPAVSPVVLVSEGIHSGVSCGRSGMRPIVGIRCHLRGHNYDLCQAEYYKLDATEKGLYEAMVAEGVTTLEAGDFRGWDLQSVALPASLTRIGDRAFKGCRSLVLRELPASLTSIGDHAFDGCFSLALRCAPKSAGRGDAMQPPHNLKAV